jgi:hypothetical protein
MPRRTNTLSLTRDKGRIAPEVCCPPRTGYDPHNAGVWPRLDRATWSALERCVRGMPWSDHLLLAAIILAAHHWPAWQILATLSMLHGRLLTLFHFHNFVEIEEWDVERQVEEDLWSGQWIGRERELRIEFWEHYQDISCEVLLWFGQLPDSEQRIYQAFLLPVLSSSREIRQTK